MKKTITLLVLPGLLMIGSIAFAQNGENGRQTGNNAKPVVQQAKKANEVGKAKPASSIATTHPVITDKKTAVEQINSSKK